MINMRYHTFKSSTTKNLLISDSQAKNLFFSNFNILSIPGGRIKDVWLFLPSPGEYEIIVLFIGGNDLFEFQRLSGTSSKSAADQLSELAEHLKELSSKVFIIGIPPGMNQPERSLAVNSLLAETSSYVADVPGILNPADDDTRLLKVSDLRSPPVGLLDLIFLQRKKVTGR